MGSPNWSGSLSNKEISFGLALSIIRTWTCILYLAKPPSRKPQILEASDGLCLWVPTRRKITEIGLDLRSFMRFQKIIHEYKFTSWVSQVYTM